MKVSIREQTLADTDHVWELLTDAFPGDDRVARLAEALLEGPSRFALVAEDDDGRIVGNLQLSRSWLDTDVRLVDVLVMSPVGVAPDRQRRGIGRRLVAQAIRQATDAGTPLIWLEGEPDYYPQFGFVRGGELGFRAPSHRIPAAAFQVATLPTYEPWMVGGFVYPDEFWADDCVGPPRRRCPLSAGSRCRCPVLRWRHGHADRSPEHGAARRRRPER